MIIEDLDQKVRFVGCGTEVIMDAIGKDPGVIRRGYERMVAVAEFVSHNLQERNLSEGDLVDLAVQFKEGVVDQLGVVKKALEYLVPCEKGFFEVAHALSTCSATLNYIKTIYV
jgi:hypothetical protein